MRLPSLLVTALLLSSCVTIPETKWCSVAGDLSAGAICAESLSHKTSDMTFDEFLEFLEASPNKAPAMCVSTDQYNALKTALEQACRELGSRCKYAIPQKRGHNDRLQSESVDWEN